MTPPDKPPPNWEELGKATTQGVEFDTPKEKAQKITAHIDQTVAYLKRIKEANDPNSNETADIEQTLDKLTNLQLALASLMNSQKYQEVVDQYSTEIERAQFNDKYGSTIVDMKTFLGDIMIDNEPLPSNAATEYTIKHGDTEIGLAKRLKANEPYLKDFGIRSIRDAMHYLNKDLVRADGTLNLIRGRKILLPRTHTTKILDKYLKLNAVAPKTKENKKEKPTPQNKPKNLDPVKPTFSSKKVEVKETLGVKPLLEKYGLTITKEGLRIDGVPDLIEFAEDTKSITLMRNYKVNDEEVLISVLKKDGTRDRLLTVGPNSFKENGQEVTFMINGKPKTFAEVSNKVKPKMATNTLASKKENKEEDLKAPKEKASKEVSDKSDTEAYSYSQSFSIDKKGDLKKGKAQESGTLEVPEPIEKPNNSLETTLSENKEYLEYLGARGIHPKGNSLVIDGIPKNQNIKLPNNTKNISISEDSLFNIFIEVEKAEGGTDIYTISYTTDSIKLNGEEMKFSINGENKTLLEIRESQPEYKSQQEYESVNAGL